jgi:hypothetical protein
VAAYGTVVQFQKYKTTPIIRQAQVRLRPKYREPEINRAGYGRNLTQDDQEVQEVEEADVSPPHME